MARNDNYLARGLRGSPLLPRIKDQPYSQTVGAGGGTRTPTEYIPTDFKSVAHIVIYLF